MVKEEFRLSCRVQRDVGHLALLFAGQGGVAEGDISNIILIGFSLMSCVDMAHFFAHILVVSPHFFALISPLSPSGMHILGDSSYPTQ